VRINVDKLLSRTSKLSQALTTFLPLPTYDNSPRIIASRTLCAVSFEHATSVHALTSLGNFTSALGILRMQYEALVKSIWALYAASENSIEKLQSELNDDTAKWADKLPTLNEMLIELNGKAPQLALNPLIEFRDYSWKPLSSYIHGGIHALSRHKKGYPSALLIQALKSSNGLLIMAGMMLTILSGDKNQSGKIALIQRQFSDCCPNLNQQSNV
jgi:hypothetical protein